MSLKQMDYDYDVAVIGAGPAGLASAIRTRWVKRYKAICCSTILLDSSYMGGLAGWRSCNFIGPSWKLNGKATINRFKKEIDLLNIPFYNSKVTRIEIGGKIKRVYTADNQLIRCLSVIIASGIKELTNERDYLNKGLIITTMGYEFIDKSLKRLFSKLKNKKIIVVGTKKLFNIKPLIDYYNKNSCKVLYVIENGLNKKRCQQQNILTGKVLGYTGAKKLKAVLVDRKGEKVPVPCDYAILDFNSYELRPTTGNYGLDNLKTTRNGFIKVDHEMQTNIPGIFAAGDITGIYASFSKAICQGIIAGLNAYRYVYKIKFGKEPPLFAYRPTDFVVPTGFKEMPKINTSLRPKIIGRLKDTQRILRQADIKNKKLLAMCNGKFTVKEIARNIRENERGIIDLMYSLAERKLITFYP